MDERVSGEEKPNGEGHRSRLRERLFEGVDLRTLGYECVQFTASEKATHVVLRRRK